MKNINMKKTLAFIAALSMTASLAACGDDGESSSGGTTAGTTEATTASTAPKELNEEDKAAIAEIDVGDVEKLENSTVKWLSTYDINPEKGKPKMPDLELFENNYGGKIEWMITSYDTRYNDLATYVIGGDSPDMFPAQEFDTFPSKVVDGMFQPWDDYLDFNDAELWSSAKGAKALAEMHTLGGKHYVAATSTYSKCIMIYNKNTIEENGLDDPVELLEEGNWTWDTFRQMLSDYCSREDDKFAYDSWYFETQFMLTTGVPSIGMENGVLKNNLMTNEVERAQNFMFDLKKDDLPLPKAEFNWTEQRHRIASGNTLFWPCGTWALWEADLSDFGKPGEIMFVPMPRDPEADAYYLPSSMDAYALCKGAPNPEGAAAYMRCKLIAGNSDAAKEITERQYREDYGWTDEMIDMMHTVDELTDANPVISFHMGLATDVANAVDDGIKQASFSGADWATTRETINGMTDIAVEELNQKIAADFS
ncbi:MAG: extracellular solute-binding protein [Oscillospiraceae bacterium]|nr:extracellular solute-binding protein [Oscillospiraceae bacterium]